MTDFKKSIGAFWLKEAKNGKKYMSGTIDGKKVVMFKNDYKKEEKHPDYQIFEQDDKYSNSGQ